MKNTMIAALATTLALALPAGAQAPAAQAVFAANCAACHQASGAGIPGAFPALKGNRFVQAEAAPVIATVLMGRGGMPTFAESLDDAQLALAVSYIRQAWGNRAGAVSAQDVQAARSSAHAPEVLKPDAPANAH